MNPRRFALENLLDQCVYAQALHAEVVALSKPDHSEEFHGDNVVGAKARVRRLAQLSEREAELEKALVRLVPAWEQFGAGEYVNATMTLMGEEGP